MNLRSKNNDPLVLFVVSSHGPVYDTNSHKSYSFVPSEFNSLPQKEKTLPDNIPVFVLYSLTIASEISMKKIMYSPCSFVLPYLLVNLNYN